MTQPLNLAQLLTLLQNETWVEENRFKFLLKSRGRRKNDQNKDASQDIVLGVREASGNKALLAQGAFLPSCLSQTKAWALVSARRLGQALCKHRVQMAEGCAARANS